MFLPGGPGEGKRYPIDEPVRGDIILVRNGKTKGKGIGVGCKERV